MQSTLTTLTVFFLSLLGAGIASGAEQHPNVLLILTDDQGWGDLHSHGNDQIDTPMMDRLRLQGARFDRFFVSPMCAPTRASLLTGRYDLRTGVSWVAHGTETLRLDEVTIADALKSAGYATGCFGKWHNGEYGPYHPNQRGFGEFFGFCRGAWENYFDPVLEHNGAPVETKGYITDVLTDAAIAFIEKNRDRPFFCYVPYNAPHHPFQVPARYFDKYRQRGFDDKTACVYGMVENIDENLTRILGKLDELKLADETIVVFAGDNGPWMPRPDDPGARKPRYNGGMKGRKAEVDEGGVRVPLFIRWPGHIRPATEVKRIAAHIDLFPTILQLCDVPMPATLPQDGLSLVPLLDGQTADWPERMIFSHQNRFGETHMTPGSVRTQHYRLVNHGAGYELFDMEKDPGQQHDVAAQKPEITERLATAYESWYQEVTSAGIDPPPVPVGYSATDVMAIQGEDARLHGGLKFRGGQGWAHDSILNWRTKDDYATWDIDVLRPGQYEVTLMYSCPQADVGARMQIEVGSQRLEATVTQAHDPPVPDKQSVATSGPVQVKEWAPLKFSPLQLERGRTTLEVRALSIPGSQAMELKEVRVQRTDAVARASVTETGTESPPQFSWQQTAASLALMNGEQVVWQFNHLQDGSEKGAPYFHPLATLDGAVLTDLRPDDHLWHRGLRFAWKKINGMDGYWDWPEGLERWPENTGNTDVTAVQVAPGKDYSARFELELSYHPPDEPPALTEKRTIAVSAVDRNGSYQIDWRGVFTAGSQGAVLDRTPILGEPDGVPWGGYAGMQLRVAKRENLAAWTLFNSEGIKVTNKMDANKAAQKKSLQQAHGKPARWLDLTLDYADGKRAGVTLFDHPGNLRHPAAWHVSSMPNELIQTPLFHGPYTMEAGKTLTFHFRIHVHSGAADKTLLEHQWQEFANSTTE